MRLLSLTLGVLILSVSARAAELPTQPEFIAALASKQAAAAVPAASEAGLEELSPADPEATLRFSHPEKGAVSVDYRSKQPLHRLLEESDSVCFTGKYIRLHLLLHELMWKTGADEGPGLARMDYDAHSQGYYVEISLSKDSSPWRFHWEGLIAPCRN